MRTWCFKICEVIYKETLWDWIHHLSIRNCECSLHVGFSSSKAKQKFSSRAFKFSQKIIWMAYLLSVFSLHCVFPSMDSPQGSSRNFFKTHGSVLSFSCYAGFSLHSRKVKFLSIQCPRDLLLKIPRYYLLTVFCITSRFSHKDLSFPKALSSLGHCGTCGLASTCRFEKHHWRVNFWVLPSRNRSACTYSTWVVLIW